MLLAAIADIYELERVLVTVSMPLHLQEGLA